MNQNRLICFPAGFQPWVKDLWRLTYMWVQVQIWKWNLCCSQTEVSTRSNRRFILREQAPAGLTLSTSLVQFLWKRLPGLAGQSEADAQDAGHWQILSRPFSLPPCFISSHWWLGLRSLPDHELPLDTRAITSFHDLYPTRFHVPICQSSIITP